MMNRSGIFHAYFACHSSPTVLASPSPVKHFTCLPGPTLYRLLGEHGIQSDSAAELRQFEERIIREELMRLLWTEREFKLRAKSDPAKLALAARVRRETTQTLGWIAHRVHMGTRKAREKAC